MKKLLLLIAFILLAQLIVQLPQVATQEMAVVTVNIAVKRGYVVVKEDITLTDECSRITFKSTEDVVYCYANSSGRMLKVLRQDDKILIEGEAFRKFSLIFVLMSEDLKALREGYLRARLEVPIVPQEASALVKVRFLSEIGLVEGLNLDPKIQLLLKDSEGYSVKSVVLDAGTVLKLNFTIKVQRWDPWPIAKIFRRTIEVISPKEATYIDELLIENYGIFSIQEIKYLLPQNTSVIGVFGGVVKYSEGRHPGCYEVERASDNKTLLRIYLLAYVNQGSRAYIKIVYRVPLKESDGYSFLPALFNPGIPIRNSSVRIIAWSPAQLLTEVYRDLARVKEQGEKISFELISCIPSVRDLISEEDTLIKVRVGVNLLGIYRPYIFSGIFLFIVFAAFFLYYRRLETVTVKKAKMMVVERAKLEPIITLSERFLEYLESKASILRRVERGKVRRAQYRWTIKSINQSIRNVESELSRTVSTLKEQQAIKVLSALRAVREVLESLEREIRSLYIARVVRREAREKIGELWDKYEELIAKAYEEVSTLKELIEE